MIRRPSLFLPVLCCCASAANIPIRVLGATQTQIVIGYAATSLGACTIAATDNNNGLALYDLDASLFAGADQDLSRTTANGFRWPTLANGLSRTVFIGGHDEVKQALDGKWYSTALQVYSDHTIAVACNGGADTGTVHASTANIPQGSTYPELPIPAAANPNPGYPAPTIDWIDRNVQYIDPTTGVLMQRVSAPIDIVIPDGAITGGTFSFVYDSASAWSNASNALTNRSAATLASTSTANAPLFVASNSAWLTGYCCGSFISDEQIVLFGKGANGTEIAEVCWSEDSGQTCVSGSIDSGPFATCAGTCGGIVASLPSSYPSNQFVSWGTWTGRAGQYDLGNQSFTGINASGSVVTMSSRAGSGFNTDRAPGSQFTLSGCTTGANVQLTVAHSDSPTQITVTQTGLAHTGCTYQDYGSGVRIVLKNSGTISLSATYNTTIGVSASGGDNGARDVCNPHKITDIATDCDGNPQSPPLSGQLCQVFMGAGLQSIVLAQDNGRTCLQSIGKNSTHSIQHLYAMSNPWITAKSWMGIGGDGLYSVTKTGTDYTKYAGGPNPADDGWTYTNISSSATPLTTQIANAGGAAASDMATGLWPAPSVNGLIGGYIETASQPGGDRTPCFRAILDGSYNLVQTYDSWRKYPFRWGGCHSGPFGTGNLTQLTTTSMTAFNNSQIFGGPYTLPVTAIRRNGTFQAYTMTISSGTAGSPTTLTSANHDLANRNGAVNFKPYVTCSGGTGTWATVNGTFHATVIDNSNFTIPVSTSGAISGTISCQTAPPLATVTVGSISNTSPPVVTIAPDGNYDAFIPDGRSMFQDGDPIVFASLAQTQQYYAKATGYTSSTFGVYTDAALTTPASYASISAAAGNQVAWAEACPSTSAATLMPNGKLYFDSGNLSGGAPLIRCVTIRVGSQPCSEWATAGEATHYPCPTNAAFSSLQNIQPGDTLYDLSSNDVPDHEYMLLLAVTVNSSTSIDLTLMRWYGNDPSWGAGGYGQPGQANASPTGTACCVKSPGWTPFVVPTMPSAWFDSTDATATPQAESPLYPGIHRDLAQITAGGNVVLAASPTNYDDVWNVPFSTFLSTPVLKTHNNVALWAGDANDVLTHAQSYPSHRQITAPLPEQVWKADASAANSDFGFPGGSPTGDAGRTVTKIPGFNYVYSITNPGGTTNIKLVQYMMNMSVQYFEDISGPTDCNATPGGPNCITDSTLGKYCEAYAVNQCVAGSAVGLFYFASTIMYDTGNCYADNQTIWTPCLYPPGPNVGWIAQYRQNPIDYNGSGGRRLTEGWSLPLQHFSFYNWIASPDAQWGFFTANPIGGKTILNSVGSVGFQMKLPGWPMPDTVSRTAYVQVPIQVSGKTGDTVRVEFGYGENGDPSSLYCTTRQETCWTSASATSLSPFLFEGETQSRASCGSGCTVHVPAIPGRLLFYRMERSNGALISSGPLQTLAVP